MIGSHILSLCCMDSDIYEIISLVRKPSPSPPAKVKEIIVKDFLHCDSFIEELKDADIVFYCLGVYSGSVKPELFRVITVDYPVALAKAVHRVAPYSRFCLLSGQGADRTEKSRIMFARDKGAAENKLSAIEFRSFHSFRPGYIYPVQKRKEPNVFYKIMRMAYPLYRLLGEKYSIRSTELAACMYDVGKKGCDKEVIENKDMIEMYSRLQQES